MCFCSHNQRAMNILFTKKFDEQEVAAQLGNNAQFSFEEVIAITQTKVTPFNLEDRSLIFTSVNSVKSFFENGFCPHENFTQQKNFNKIYAVGLKTKAELRKNGFGTFKVAKNAADLSDFIIEHCPEEKFLHFCGNLALDVLNKTLPLQNISYRKIIVYETNLLFPKIEGNYDAVVFFSPSGVRSFAKLNSLEGKILFSIGKTTEKELKKITDQEVITSSESNLKDLLKLIKAKATGLSPDAESKKI